MCRGAHERDSETHGRDGWRSDPNSHGAWHTRLRISAPLRLPFLLAPSLGRSLFRQESGIGVLKCVCVVRVRVRWPESAPPLLYGCAGWRTCCAMLRHCSVIVSKPEPFHGLHCRRLAARVHPEALLCNRPAKPPLSPTHAHARTGCTHRRTWDRAQAHARASPPPPLPPHTAHARTHSHARRARSARGSRS